MSKLFPPETVFGYPVGKKNHYRCATDGDGKAYIFKDEKLRQYEQLFADNCKIYKGMQIAVPFVLYLAIFTDDRRQDLDNVLTSILDNLQAVGAIKNDCLCRKCIVEKRAAKGQPKVTFSIEADFEEPNLFN